MLRCELIDGRPQLPPNTKWYRYEADGGPCWKTNERCFSLLEKDVLERKVIAAIFRCEWLDIGLKQSKQASGSAFENAMAWRAWGENDNATKS